MLAVHASYSYDLYVHWTKMTAKSDIILRRCIPHKQYNCTTSKSCLKQSSVDTPYCSWEKTLFGYFPKLGIYMRRSISNHDNELSAVLREMQETVVSEDYIGNWGEYNAFTDMTT